ncbi:MAG: DUF296 domain-containing protein [Candidatus Heimdallarchaeota archaeon]|nr:DUF296 domain-containing protein [Candidatus Heimdallarchaeota archaeon]
MKTMVMEQQKIHLIKLEKGEDLLKSILKYVKERSIGSGFLTGIGALATAKIGYFDIEKKRYLENITHNVELIACMGNIAINKDNHEPIAHVHITVADREGRTLGGHLNEGSIVSVTAEIYLVETRPFVYRKKEEETGLHLLDPKN